MGNEERKLSNMLTARRDTDLKPSKVCESYFSLEKGREVNPCVCMYLVDGVDVMERRPRLML